MTEKQDKEKMIEFMAESIREVFSVCGFAVVSKDVCKKLAAKLHGCGLERLTREQCFEYDSALLKKEMGICSIAELNEEAQEEFTRRLTAMGYGSLDFARALCRRSHD